MSNSLQDKYISLHKSMEEYIKEKLKIKIEDEFSALSNCLFNNFESNETFDSCNKKLSKYYLKISELKTIEQFENMFEPLRKKKDKTALVSAHGSLMQTNLTILVPEDTYIITMTDVNNTIVGSVISNIYDFLKDDYELFRVSKSDPSKKNYLKQLIN